jgi:hypothetical protein
VATLANISRVDETSQTRFRAEIWQPQRGHIWMRRWLETRRMRKAAREALALARAARPPRFRQLAFTFFNTS